MPEASFEAIQNRIYTLNKEIDAACANAGRDREEVRLLAVSKTFPLGAIKSAYETGQRDFGENYLQEAVGKVDAFSEPVWHFIGAIQSNKTQMIANHFDWIHSIASRKVARRISEQRDPARGPVKVLFQVNVSGEASKSGVAPADAPDLVSQCRGLDGVELCGLMTIPEAGVDPRPAFRLMRELKDTIAADLAVESFTQLSMGMTRDFADAIAEGATWIRVGTGIFGERDYTNTD